MDNWNLLIGACILLMTLSTEIWFLIVVGVLTIKHYELSKRLKDQELANAYLDGQNDELRIALTDSQALTRDVLREYGPAELCTDELTLPLPRMVDLNVRH